MRFGTQTRTHPNIIIIFFVFFFFVRFLSLITLANACLRSPYAHTLAQLLYLSLREFNQSIMYLFKANYSRPINNPTKCVVCACIFLKHFFTFFSFCSDFRMIWCTKKSLTFYLFIYLFIERLKWTKQCTHEEVKKEQEVPRYDVSSAKICINWYLEFIEFDCKIL